MPETETQNEVIDLGFNVTEADVARPILKDGTYDMTIAFTRQETSKNGHPMLVVGYRLAQQAEDTNGKPLNPGFMITQRYLTQPTGKMTSEQIQDRFKRIHFAAAGTGKVSTGAWTGKTIRARVKIREAEGDFGESNDVSAVYPKK
jgi:hypothetical protein